MSSIVSSITGGGRGQGADFAAQAANLVNPATQGQADQQYGNLQQGIQNQQAFLQALQGQNGIQNQSNAFNQLQGVANGTGPNPALAQLNNATGANVANQAALMAGQRNSGANAGLMARQAGMQGGALQQQAVGQGAALQAQQSLNAIGQMGQMAGQQVAQQGAATGALTGAGQSAYGQVTGNINNQNQAAVGNVSQQNQANAHQAGAQLQLQGDIFKGVMSGVGSAAAMAEGGAVQSSGPQSHFGRHIHGKTMMAQGGPVKALLSPGEKYVSPDQLMEIEHGANPMSIGKTVPGKPKVAGAKDSYKNDTVPATLEEGGIVIPRSITQGKNPEQKAAAFVAAVLRRHK